MDGSKGPSASDISEMLLEQTAKALLSGDFEAFSLCFALPHTIDTPDRKTTLKTVESLRLMFFRVVHDYRDRNVTALIRFCEVAEFHGPHRVKATHVSHVMSGNQRIIDPFHGYSVIDFIGGRWQLTSTQYAVDNETTVGRVIQTLSDREMSQLIPDTATLKKETRP